MHDMTELDINVMKAAIDRLETDLQRMTAWAQTLANTGTTYKVELAAEKNRNEVLDGAWTTANNHREELQAENARLREALEDIIHNEERQGSKYRSYSEIVAHKALEEKR